MYADNCHSEFRVTCKDGIYKFADGFLEECWQLACENNLEHQLFGNIIKKLGYMPIQDYSDFQNQYLDESPNIKSARSSRT